MGNIIKHVICLWWCVCMRDKIGYRVITVIAFALSGCFDVGLETKREGRLDNRLMD